MCTNIRCAALCLIVEIVNACILTCLHHSLYMYTTEELEGNIDENKRSAELLELQETLSWPSVSQLDTDSYIPEVRAHTL